MVSPKTLCLWLQRCGMINFHQFPTVWQDWLQNVYVFFQFSIYMFFVLAHLYSTVTRAIRYRPEFLQTLLEDGILLYFAYCLLYFRLRYQDISHCADCLEYFFSHAFPEINEQCARESRMVLGFLFALVFTAVLGCFAETFLSENESESSIRRDIYRTKHPERRLPFALRVPYVDETEPTAYVILYGGTMFAMIYFLNCASLSVSMVPVIAIHIRGQYRILSHYVALIGRPHRDALGYRIYYTDIERNDYVIKMYSGVGRSLMSQHRMERRYERQFLRQIILYHNKLVKLMTQLGGAVRQLTYGLLVANNIIISLCLYQMVGNPTKISPLRYIKFIAELAAVCTEYLVLCNISETYEECHEHLRRALADASWLSCSSDMRKDLVFLIMRVQLHNQWRFFKGAFVLNRRSFLNVIRVAYNFVNFMRLSIQR